MGIFYIRPLPVKPTVMPPPEGSMMKLGKFELNQIYTGDAREFAKDIPDESVDLIFTDPVYANMEDYRWLSETAARILKPNKSLLVWHGIGFLPETINALVAGGMSYKWQMPVMRPTGVKSRYCMKNVFSNWRSLLWFEKGTSFPELTISDVLYSKDNGGNIHHGKWDKSFHAVNSYVYRFTLPGEIVVDFFSGGGSLPAVCKFLGRNFFASEIDPEKAEISRQRLLKLLSLPLRETGGITMRAPDLGYAPAEFDLFSTDSTPVIGDESKPAPSG